jgi:hypothetical protein
MPSKRIGKSGKTAKGDFGVPADDTRNANRVSEQTKHRGGSVEPPREGDLQPRAGVESREAGVGGREAGAGSSSGGDLDPDITGVGSAGDGLAEGGPDDANSIGQAETSADRDDFASGPPARGDNQPATGRPKARTRGSSTNDRTGGDTRSGNP